MQLIVYINQTFDQEEALPWLRHCLCSCNTISINCRSSSSNRASGVNCQSITWLSHRLCFSNKTASCDEDKICEFSVLQQYFDRLLTVIITAADHQQAQQASVLALLKALIPPIISAANFLCNSDSTICQDHIVSGGFLSSIVRFTSDCCCSNDSNSNSYADPSSIQTVSATAQLLTRLLAPQLPAVSVAGGGMRYTRSPSCAPN